MEYWVAMNGKELQISLLLLQKMELSGVIEIAADFSPQKEDLVEMARKKFFEDGEDGMSWNPFVKTVLWCAANAQSELRADCGQALCHLYFYGEEMILMTKEASEDLYIFYYVPLLPKAIGGLTKSLSDLEALMPAAASGEAQIVPPSSEETVGPEAIRSLSELTVPNQIDSEHFPLMVDGWCFGEHSLENLLIKSENGPELISMKDGRLWTEPVGFIDFIQYVSRWIVRTHGRSIAAKEKNDGGI